MKLLVLTSEPIAADALRSALPDGVDPADSEVMVVAPAVQESGLRFWMSDADEAIAEADKVRRETVERLGEEGIAASGDRGESDPMMAIRDALMTFQADRIVLFTHPDAARGYREDLDAGEIERRFGLPVDAATVSD
jgi:ornithine carbamoyltransferase